MEQDLATGTQGKAKVFFEDLRDVVVKFDRTTEEAKLSELDQDKLKYQQEYNEALENMPETLAKIKAEMQKQLSKNETWYECIRVSPYMHDWERVGHTYPPHVEALIDVLKAEQIPMKIEKVTEWGPCDDKHEPEYLFIAIPGREGRARVEEARRFNINC